VDPSPDAASAAGSSVFGGSSGEASLGASAVAGGASAFAAAASGNLQKSSIVWTEMSGGHHAVDKVAHGAACSVPRRRIAWLEDHITMTSLCFLPQRGRTHYVPLPPELQKGIGEEDGPVTAAGQQWGGG